MVEAGKGMLRVLARHALQSQEQRPSRKGLAGHLDSDPDAHAVGTELDWIHRRSKRFERAVAVQAADLMEATPWTGPADRGIFRVLAQLCRLRRRQIVHGTALLACRSAVAHAQLDQLNENAYRKPRPPVFQERLPVSPCYFGFGEII